MWFNQKQLIRINLEEQQASDVSETSDLEVIPVIAPEEQQTEPSQCFQ